MCVGVTKEDTGELQLLLFHFLLNRREKKNNREKEKLQDETCLNDGLRMVAFPGDNLIKQVLDNTERVLAKQLHSK